MFCCSVNYKQFITITQGGDVEIRVKNGQIPNKEEMHKQ